MRRPLKGTGGRVGSLFACPAVLTALAACGGDGDDAGGGGGVAKEAEPELTRLADLAASDALGAGGGKFQDTGFLVYCRQNAGYEGSVFEAIGFSPGGSQKADEFCYNVSDDRAALGLSRRSATSGKGSCLIVTIAAGG